MPRPSRALPAAATLIAVLLPVASTVGDPPEWAADGTTIDCHFEGDETRNLLVRRPGGQGVAYGFEFDITGPESSVDMDFCPHCSLSVLVADAGLDPPPSSRSSASTRRRSRASSHW